METQLEPFLLSAAGFMSVEPSGSSNSLFNFRPTFIGEDFFIFFFTASVGQRIRAREEEKRQIFLMASN